MQPLRSNRNAWWVALCVAILGAGVFLHRGYPLADAAAFEYYGRAMLHGRVLYRDVWDNKLPGIYLVNAFMQMVFGEHYLLHTVFECGVGVLSGIAFWNVLRHERLPYATPATLVLVALLCVIQPEMNQTEFFALPLILVAVRLRRVPAASGALIGFAAFFWVPSLLLLFALWWSGRPWLRAVSAVAIVAAGLALMYAILGPRVMLALVQAWRTYVGAPPHQSALHNIRVAGNQSGAFVLLLVLAAVLRVAKSEEQRFGLLWSAAMAVATLVGGPRFYTHYAIPLLPALLYAICTFAGESIAHSRVRYALLGIAALAIPFVGNTLYHSYEHSTAEANLTLRTARFVARGNAATPILLATPKGYEPSIFLALHAIPPNPYAIVADANPRSLTKRATHTGAKVLVFLGTTEDAAGSSMLPAACTAQVAPWRIAIHDDAPLAARLCSTP